MTTYTNPWARDNEPDTFTAYEKPLHVYRGVSVYHRAGGFDYVANGGCITQRAGCTRHKEVIDALIAGEDPIPHNEKSRSFIPAPLCKHCGKPFALDFKGQTACLHCIETRQNHREA